MSDYMASYPKLEVEQPPSNHHRLKEAITLAVGIGLIAYAFWGCEQRFIRSGLTAEQWRQDSFDCRQKVYTMNGGMNQMDLGTAIFAREDLKDCMLAKGYRVE